MCIVTKTPATAMNGKLPFAKEKAKAIGKAKVAAHHIPYSALLSNALAFSLSVMCEQISRTSGD
jgi:hypothetical protein